ncbi:MAG: hypothetical protein M3R37_03275 [Actinomycetota bacterium]|nr:hypothetical protein [Actinomycetota bacterium]
MRLVSTLGWFVLMCLLVAGAGAIAGLLFAHFRGGVDAKTAVAYALWICGALLVVVTAGSGSTSQMASQSRTVVGGRFGPGSSIPMPRSSFVFVLVGAVVIGIGVVVDLYA